jgi:hypothetical protein
MIHVFTPVVWKIYVPPRIHIFLWLLANNITFTRDNLALAKRREVLDKTCVFCSENESVAHLLFGCIAQCFWSVISEIIGFSIVSDFESMAKWWLREERYNDVNVLSVAVLWTIWKTKNHVLSGCAMEQDGEAIWEMRKCTWKLETGEQGDRGRQAGDLGRDARNKKLKPVQDRLGSRHAAKKLAI